MTLDLRQTLDSTPSPTPGPSAAPEKIGRYRVVKVLGEGSFGRVYLAHDDDLDRAVVIKVPLAKRISRPADAEAYLAEARTLASLSHPHIVSVYDVGRTEDGSCFVVSKFIEGSDLARVLRASPPNISDAARLVATVAEALHHAHRHGLVHRDVKPANILIDRAGAPILADFGLALKDVDYGKGGGLAGTPAYMSPEQAKGEGHRVDGRSDIYSLGVVFYELLTKKRPFQSDSQDELLERIASDDVKPPRQLDETIPKELERICLKALSRRASDRYTAAKDMADDLLHFFGEQPSKQPSTERLSASSPPSAAATPSVPTPPSAGSASQPLKIVPKGLRSFDAHDASFFLELLPGPRDRDGLPDTIRFWKTRIEERDADQTFAVGLIYGPSGCGKSSLVKAGLLPHLSDDILVVYLEATAAETVTRLLNGLRKRCPSLAANVSLKAALGTLRRGDGIPAGKKVLIVLDQFEQWLHAYKDQENTDLVNALRQCDGVHLQAIVMVRDDFWLAVSRFLRELEIRLLEGQNSALADLFDVHHAKKVLAAFGRAFTRLPEKPSDASTEQTQFLEHAVAGLAQDGKVISVRLSLFAEMMKGKSWTPAALKAVGGTEGVGVTFLEETFSASTAPPEHRYHQKAARTVLKALLPDSGADIKGHMRSREELLEASGYLARPRDFDDLLGILDGEIRLLTPTDPEGKSSDESTTKVQAGAKYYQLTHDYLVPSLRDWLTRKQKETRRGRAELLLADRAAVWSARPESRQLPSLWQWLSIRTLTAKKAWTPPQRKMMRSATRFHVGRGVAVIAVVALTGLIGWESFGRLRAEMLQGRLLEAKTAEVPAVIEQMAPWRRWVDPLLKTSLAQAQAKEQADQQLHLSAALLPVDPSQRDYLYGRLLKADAQETLLIRTTLADHKKELTEKLWAHLEDAKNDQGERLRTACVLAEFAPEDARWQKVAGDVASTLVVQPPFTLAGWTEGLKGAAKSLLSPLADILEDERRSVPERGLVATVYGTYAAQLPEAYGLLEKRLSAQKEPPVDRPQVGGKVVADKAASDLGPVRRQASLAVALLVMGRADKVWPLLRSSRDPSVRSELMERIAAAGVAPRFLTSRLERETDPSIQQAILLALREYGLDRLTPAERQNLIPILRGMYREHGDSGFHGATESLLCRWGDSDATVKMDRALATGKIEKGRRWYVSPQGLTMVTIPKGESFRFGGDEGLKAETRRITRSFAIAAKDITVAQFAELHRAGELESAHKVYERFSPTPDCPVTSVCWYDAAAYCNWLSEREGLAKDQWCYVPNKSGKYADGMSMAPEFLGRTGYRLPTEAEWECACRAGSETTFSIGEDERLLGKYAWTFENSGSGSRSHPVGSQKPNGWGLFDVHGNVWQWCQDEYTDSPQDKDPSETEIGKDRSRVLRGGAFDNQASGVRSAYRVNDLPTNRYDLNGFRPARTLLPGSLTALPLTP